MQAYVLSQQEIHSSLIQANSHATEDESTHKAHMDKHFDGLTAYKNLTMKHLMSTWEDRSKETKIDVFKVGLKLIKDLCTADFVLAAADTARAKQGKPRTGDAKCPKHPYRFHK